MVIPECGVCFSVYQIVISKVAFHLLLPLPLGPPKHCAKAVDGRGSEGRVNLSPPHPGPLLLRRAQDGEPVEPHGGERENKEDGLFYASTAPSEVQRTTAAKAAPTFST